uniref:Uncharacterized protein n=2 Tax=Ciona intestinalis TaxID=7719 RepID=F6ST74_CIOIN
MKPSTTKPSTSKPTTMENDVTKENKECGIDDVKKQEAWD